VMDPDGINITWITFCGWHRSQDIFGNKVETAKNQDKMVKILEH